MSSELALTAEPATYLLVETEEPGTGGFCRDAVAQARLGHSVVLFLLQGAVVHALAGRSTEPVDLLREGGRLWVDRFSLAQRGLDEARLVPGATVVDMDEVAAAFLAPAVRVVWH